MSNILPKDKHLSDYAIILFFFQDTYQNLTIKTVMGLKWMSIFCPKAKYVLKTDDDIFVNIPLLIKALEKETKDFSSHISGIYGIYYFVHMWNWVLV